MPEQFIKQLKVKKWTIQIVDPKHNSQDFIAGYLIGEWKGDSFIKYNRNEKNGKIAYDRPEIVPKYLKEKLRIELNKLIDV